MHISKTSWIIIVFAILLTIAIMDEVRANINSTYSGANVAQASTTEEGIELCKKAHVLGFLTSTKGRMMPPELMHVMVKNAIDSGYCIGHWAQGDREGNHQFSCYGVAWPEGTKQSEDITKECTDLWEESKKNYGDWFSKQPSVQGEYI